jgi:hypothetical protein
MLSEIRLWFADRAYLVHLFYICFYGTFWRWTRNYPLSKAMDGGFDDTKKYAKRVEALLRIKIERHKRSMARCQEKIEYYNSVIEESKRQQAEAIEKFKQNGENTTRES